MAGIGTPAIPGSGGGGGGSSSITSLLGITTKGQALSANSLPVVIASDNTVSVAISSGGPTQYTAGGTPPANPVAGTLLWNNGGTWETTGSAFPFPIQVSTALPNGSNSIGAVTLNGGNGSSAIGTVRVNDGNGNNVTSTGNALDINLKTIAGSLTLATVTNVAQLNGTGPTFNSTTYSAKEGLDNNILGVLGTAFTTAGIVNVQGTAQQGGTLNTYPLNLGAQAINAEATATTNTKQVQLNADLTGKLIVMPYANKENFISGVTAAITGTSATQIIASSTGFKFYCTSILVTNSHASVGTLVTIQDNAASPVVLYEGYAAPAGGGFSCTFPVPLVTTLSKALMAINTTTGSNVYAAASGYYGT